MTLLKHFRLCNIIWKSFFWNWFIEQIPGNGQTSQPWCSAFIPLIVLHLLKSAQKINKSAQSCKFTQLSKLAQDLCCTVSETHSSNQPFRFFLLSISLFCCFHWVTVLLWGFNVRTVLNHWRSDAEKVSFEETIRRRDSLLFLLWRFLGLF